MHNLNSYIIRVTTVQPRYLIIKINPDRAKEDENKISQKK